LMWDIEICPNGQPRGETQRAIWRWAPTATNDGAKYEYRTWCFARATDKDFQQDISNCIETRLEQLAESLSYAKTDFA